MLTTAGRAGLVLVFAVLAASSWYLWIDTSARLGREVAALEEKLERVKRENQLSLAAASQAMAAREGINAEFLARVRDLEDVLGGSACAVPVPEYLRLRLQPSGDGPARRAAGAHSPAGPLGHPDDGGHGQSDS